VGEWPVQAWQSESPLNKPFLAVDQVGTVWASDPESHRILGFEDGEIAYVFGARGSGLNGLNLPTGLALGPKGQLYVADSENHRVLVFDTLPGLQP